MLSFDLIMCSHGDRFDWERSGYVRRTARFFRCFQADPRIRRILLVPNTRSYAHHVRRLVGLPRPERRGVRSTLDRIGERDRMLTFYVPMPGELSRRALRDVNRRVLSADYMADRIRETAAELRFENTLLWVDDPFAADLIGRVDESISAFDCIDDWRLNPKLAPFVAQLDGAYERAFSRADVLTAVSRPLRELIAQRRPDARWVPNGVDAERFAVATGEPAELAGIAGPRVGYVAAMGTRRIDTGLMAAVARELPHVAFVFVGPDPPVELDELPNCHALGAVPHERVPAVLAGLDATMLPHKLDAYNASAYPLKLLEYLAAGKPIVATPVSGVDDFGDLVVSACGPREFARAISEALRGGHDEDAVARRRAVVAGATWKARFDEAMLAVTAAYASHHETTDVRGGRVAAGARP